ncbi:MAG: hypothetical protein GY925_10540 [Actinomycetia bacterium]|nr:hypothetical protein [Actinomycetes bacterium]
MNRDDLPTEGGEGSGVQSFTAELGRGLIDELRPAIETAFHVARSDVRSGTPQVEPPTALRKFLSFSRLPPKALDLVREAVDSDDPFRKRVVEVTEAHEVGELGWAWLARPEGWVDTLMSAEAAAFKRRRSAVAEVRERELQRQLQRLEADHDRLRDALESADLLRAEIENALDETRQDLDRAGSHLAETVDERDQLRSRVADLDRRATRAEQGLGKERFKVKKLQLELDAAIVAAGQAVEAVGSVLEDDEEPSDDAPVKGAGNPHVGSDPGGAADAISAAAELTASLAIALRDAAERLRPDPRASSGAADDTEAESEPCVMSIVARSVKPRRTPLRRARGVPDDSMDGVADLIGVPGIRVVVDGYNVAKTGWPDLGLEFQRERFLSSLAARLVASKTIVDVVFDGSDVVAPPATTSPQVRVSWSPKSRIADDVIIDMVEAIAASVPVLVVSSDHDVQDRARSLGANIAGSPAFYLWLR